MPPLMNFLGQTFRWMHPLIGVILICAFWAIPAGGAVYSIPKKPEIVPGSGAHPNTVLSTTSEYWQPNDVIARPTRITWEATSPSRMECYVLGLSSIPNLKTTKTTPTDNSLESDRTDTYISTEINPGTDRIRSFTIYTDIDILFENAGATTITVTAEIDGVPPFNTNTTLPITVTGSGTASAVDFTPVSNFNIVVLAGASSGSETFTLTPESDSVDETDETITVASTSSLVNGTDTISLRDDDAAPSGISLNATPNVAQENEGAEEFTVTATVDGFTTYATAQTIPITVTGTLTASAVDFTPVPNFSIEIPAESNSGSATFTLTPENDSVDETDETITIASSNSAVTNSITFLLRDDDATPRGINILTNTNVIYEDLGAQDIALTLEISGPTTYATEQVVPLTVTGTGATGVVGFTPIANFSIVLPAEALTASSALTITPTNNLVDEANETITLASSSPQITGPAIINLVDDDPTPSITLNATPAAISEADGSTQVTITAEWIGQVVFPTDQIIPLSITGSGMLSAVDFIPVSDIDLSIAAGANSGTATFTLTPIDNTEPNVNEIVTVSSASPLVTTSALINLIDDDEIPTITLSVSPESILENNGATTVTVTATLNRQLPLDSDQILPIRVAGSGMLAAVDFLPVQDFDLTLAAGTYTGTAIFTLTATDDSEDEINETITVGSTNELVTNSATIVLVDDDDTPSISLSAAPSSVREDDGPTEIIVTATVVGTTTFGAPEVLLINVRESDVPSAVDFLPVADFNLTVGAGSSTGTATFILTPENDIKDEVNELVTIASTSPLTTDHTTITLIDDDDAGQVVLSVTPETIYEDRGTQPVAITGTLASNRAFSMDRIVTLSISGSSDPNAVDFEPVADIDLVFQAGLLTSTAMFDLIPVDDLEFESDATITVSSTDAIVSAPVFVTLVNDDAEPEGVVLEASPSVIREDAGPTKVTVTANVQGGTQYSTDQNIVLAITDDGDPATVGYTSVGEITVTIPAGTSSGNVEFDITPENNDVHQPDGMVTINSSSPLVLSTTNITLENDDATPTGIALSVQPTSISEAAGATPVNVTAAVQGGTTYLTEQTITVTASGSGQIYAVDFDAVPDFAITIPARSKSASTIIELVPENDQEDEQNETITFSSTNSLVTQEGSVTIVDDDQAPTGIAVTLNPDVVAENAGPTEITVTLNVTGGTQYAEEKALTLRVTGSGLPGAVGFAPIPPIMLSLPSGEDMLSTTFALEPVDNLFDETDEILTIAVTGDGVRTEAQLTLIDDDPEPAGFTLAVTPEIIIEGDGPTTINVTATVTGSSRYSTMQTLDISVAGATAGSVGFESIPDFTIEVAPGADSGTNTFVLTPQENTVLETDATVTVTALHMGKTINATLLLQDDDQATARVTDVNAALLPEATRAIIASSVGAVSVRIEAFRNNHSASAGSFSSTLSGLMMRFNGGAPHRRPVPESTWASRLNNNSLAASLNGRITVWGHADHRALSGNNPDYPLGYDGSVSSFHAGADMAFGAFLVGISASQSNGDLDYEYSGGTNSVNLRAPLKGLYQINTRMLSPYVNWSWSANSGVWTMASFGAGDVELSDPDMASEQAETSLLAFAAGIDLRLITAQSGFSLAVKGATWTGQMDLDENASRISGLAVNVRRIQMSFEGAYRIGLASKGMFQPFVEAGVRGDGGDGQTGAGLEMGGGARLALPSTGLRFTGKGRVLVAHKGNVDEWGFGGMLSYSPGGNTGPTLELGSSTGHMFGGTQIIWNDTAWLTGPNRGFLVTKFQSLLGYGFAMRDGTVTPYTGVELDRGVNTRMGAEYRFGTRLNIRLEASHRMASTMHHSSPIVRGLITLR